jgi:hypothetical protein
VEESNGAGEVVVYIGYKGGSEAVRDEMEMPGTRIM